MYPYLFGVEYLSMYGICLAIGLLGAMLLFKLLCKKMQVSDDSYTFYSLLGIISIALGLLGAVLFQSVYDVIDQAVHGQKVKFALGGMTFMGGLIFGVVTFVAGTAIFAKGKVRRDFFLCASIAAPCIVLGHTCGRLGCFCAGCCYGKPTSGPLGVLFPGDTQKVLPTQLFEAAFLAVLLGVMLVLLLKFRRHRVLLPLYGIAYAVWRFCIEFARGDDRGSFIPGISPSQTQSIVLLLVAVALAVWVFALRREPFSKAQPIAVSDPAAQDTAEESEKINDKNSVLETDEKSDEKNEKN